MDGTICAWGHRPIANKFKNTCLFKFLIYDYEIEHMPNGRKNYNRLDKLVPVTGIEARCDVERLPFKEYLENDLIKKKVSRAKSMGYGNIYDSLQPTDAIGEDSYVDLENTENSKFSKKSFNNVITDMSSIDRLNTNENS